MSETKREEHARLQNRPDELRREHEGLRRGERYRVMGKEAVAGRPPVFPGPGHTPISSSSTPTQAWWPHGIPSSPSGSATTRHFASGLADHRQSTVVFQHADTHLVAAWYLQEANVRFGTMLTPSMVDGPAWKIVEPR